MRWNRLLHAIAEYTKMGGLAPVSVAKAWCHLGAPCSSMLNWWALAAHSTVHTVCPQRAHAQYNVHGCTYIKPHTQRIRAAVFILHPFSTHAVALGFQTLGKYDII